MLHTYVGLPSASVSISEGDISQTSASTASVVLHWKVKGDNISRVVITSSPALPCGDVNVTECEVGEEEREWNQTVQFGVKYNFTVRAINSCGDEAESDTLQLLLNGGHMHQYRGCSLFYYHLISSATVPDKIGIVSLNPAYYNSGILEQINITWNEVSVSHSSLPG